MENSLKTMVNCCDIVVSTYKTIKFCRKAIRVTGELQQITKKSMTSSWKYLEKYGKCL